MSKNLHFSKGVSPSFWSKIETSSSILLGKSGLENVFGGVLDRKSAFLDDKRTSI